jgi:hypothetical protein
MIVFKVICVGVGKIWTLPGLFGTVRRIPGSQTEVDKLGLGRWV